MNIFDKIMVFEVTLRGRDQPGRPCDGVLLDVVAALELDAGRGRDDGDGHAVPPALLVSPGPGHQQQVLVLRLQTRLGRVNMCYYIGLKVLLLELIVWPGLPCDLDIVKTMINCYLRRSIKHPSTERDSNICKVTC